MSGVYWTLLDMEGTGSILETLRLVEIEQDAIVTRVQVEQAHPQLTASADSAVAERPCLEARVPILTAPVGLERPSNGQVAALLQPVMLYTVSFTTKDDVEMRVYVGVEM